MTTQSDIELNIRHLKLPQLISELSNKDGLVRRHARERVEHSGYEATPRLIELLDSPNINARWEAAKALIHIADPTAGPALVRALMDESFEIQWLAAEALIALGQDAIGPLLEGIIHNYGSIFIRQGAHHVLHDLEQRQLLSPEVHRVLDDLRCLEPTEPIPLSAVRALETIGNRHKDVPTTSHN